VVPDRKGSGEELHSDALAEESNDRRDVREKVIDEGVSFVVRAGSGHPYAEEEEEGGEEYTVIAASEGHLDVLVVFGL